VTCGTDGTCDLRHSPRPAYRRRATRDERRGRRTWNGCWSERAPLPDDDRPGNGPTVPTDGANSRLLRTGAVRRNLRFAKTVGGLGAQIWIAGIDPDDTAWVEVSTRDG
jgi:hypothetical protein